jgi:hypothetical protein
MLTDIRSILRAAGSPVPGGDPSPGYIPDQPPPQPEIMPPAPRRAPDEEPQQPEVDEPLDSPGPKPMVTRAA